VPSYSSHITAVQGVYAGLTAAAFPGAARPAGPFLDEAPTTDGSGVRLPPPYVVLRDEGATPAWTFTGNAGVAVPGQNALVTGTFCLEAYALSLGDCDAIVKVVLWNGSAPNLRAGLAFASFTLDTPLRGLAGAVVPTKTQRGYAGYSHTGLRVHVTKQWFKVQYAIAGDGL
jgi:hypothetical protein